MDRAHLGQRIREARQQKGYTQHALAEQANMAEVYLGEIERGIKMPRIPETVFMRC